MSRKDFELIAAIIRGLCPGALSEDNHAMMQWRATIKAFKHDLWMTNRRFDVDRFERACQPGANVRSRKAA
jgi:hypothetical protein